VLRRVEIVLVLNLRKVRLHVVKSLGVTLLFLRLQVVRYVLMVELASTAIRAVELRPEIDTLLGPVVMVQVVLLKKFMFAMGKRAL